MTWRRTRPTLHIVDVVKPATAGHAVTIFGCAGAFASLQFFPNARSHQSPFNSRRAQTTCPAKYSSTPSLYMIDTARLLQRVRQLVRHQPAACIRAGIIFSFGKRNVFSQREGPRID